MVDAVRRPTSSEEVPNQVDQHPGEVDRDNLVAGHIRADRVRMAEPERVVVGLEPGLQMARLRVRGLRVDT